MFIIMEDLFGVDFGMANPAHNKINRLETLMERGRDSSSNNLYPAMGKHFGELAKVQGIVTFKLSQYEQKAFTGYFSHSFFNLFRRIRSNVFIIAPPFLVGYAVYEWAETTSHHMKRKNPKDYENDK